MHLNNDTICKPHFNGLINLLTKARLVPKYQSILLIFRIIPIIKKLQCSNRLKQKMGFLIFPTPASYQQHGELFHRFFQLLLNQPQSRTVDEF